MTYDIIPLFSKVFYKNQLDVDVKKYVSLIENKFENSGTNSPTDVDNIALTSSSRFVLDAQKFVDLKNIKVLIIIITIIVCIVVYYIYKQIVTLVI